MSFKPECIQETGNHLPYVIREFESAIEAGCDVWQAVGHAGYRIVERENPHTVLKVWNSNAQSQMDYVGCALWRATALLMRGGFIAGKTSERGAPWVGVNSDIKIFNDVGSNESAPTLVP